MSTEKPDMKNENIPDVDAPQEEELSLDQLSQAYARVLLVRKQESGEADDGENTDPVSVEESSENDVAEAILDFAVAKKANKRKHKSLSEIDADDNASCPISPESILEAILFVGVPKGEKLTSRKIAAVMRDVSPKEVKKMAAQLNAKYEKENAAYKIVIENGNISMKLTDDLEFVQNHFYGRDRAVRLSQAATDGLAVIAYNQPVTREQVEKICGKPMGAILNQLVRRGLLDLEQSAGKRSNNVYRTTERFLNLFGLETIEDLPRASAVSDLEELED